MFKVPEAVTTISPINLADASALELVQQVVPAVPSAVTLLVATQVVPDACATCTHSTVAVPLNVVVNCTPAAEDDCPTNSTIKLYEPAVKALVKLVMLVNAVVLLV